MLALIAYSLLIVSSQCPDFSQTGDEHKGIIEALMENTMRTAVVPFVNKGDDNAKATTVGEVINRFTLCMNQEVRRGW